MRLIKENDTERKHKCKLCKSIFAYENSDIDPNLYPTVRCPVCGKLNEPSIFDRKVKK